MIEYTAETLTEALEKAAEDKNCTVEELKYYTKETEDGVIVGAYTQDDIKEFIFDYLGNFFVGIGQDIEVAIEETETNGYIVRLNADNNAILIGRQGKTLAAFNTIMRGAVNSEFKSRIDVLIDINNYKEERYHKLTYIAKNNAKQVQRSHVDAVLDPMPNDERKVIHKALAGWHNIHTQSEGEGADRHVVIKYVPDEE